MQVELRHRLIFGPVFALVVVGAVVADLWLQVPYAVLSLLGLGVIAAALEYCRLLRPLAPGVQRVSLTVLGLLLVMMPWLISQPWWPYDPAIPYHGVILGLGFIWIALRQFQAYGTERFTTNVGATTLGLCYVGILPAMLAALVVGEAGEQQRGHLLLLLVITTVKLGDICAFTGGKLMGRHKMAPRVSPGKTWEGFAASLLGAVGGSYLFVVIAMACGADNPLHGWWQPAVWGLILGPVGVLGDLWESGIKRDLQVKDSGNTIPGFGGILDIFDAIILAAPIAYALAIIL